MRRFAGMPFDDPFPNDDLTVRESGSRAAASGHQTLVLAGLMLAVLALTLEACWIGHEWSDAFEIDHSLRTTTEGVFTTVAFLPYRSCVHLILSFVLLLPCFVLLCILLGPVPSILTGSSRGRWALVVIPPMLAVVSALPVVGGLQHILTSQSFGELQAQLDVAWEEESWPEAAAIAHQLRERDGGNSKWVEKEIAARLNLACQEWGHGRRAEATAVIKTALRLRPDAVALQKALTALQDKRRPPDCG
jgi:hypothetical protein